MADVFYIKKEEENRFYFNCNFHMKKKKKLNGGLHVFEIFINKQFNIYCISVDIGV